MILVLTISTFYIFLIGFFTYGWYKLKKNKKSNNNNSTKISLIVAFRNEEKNLSDIIKDIVNQDYPAKKVEVIFINDHSEDKSIEILKELIKKKDNFKILELKELTGKKQALILGIKNSTGNLIVSTDADCRMKKKWLSTISSFYFSTKAKMIVCPVIYSSKKPFFSFENIQALEFLSLTATTAGSIGINKPIMCNGANLAFEKKVFLEFTNPTKAEVPSGDDTFLLFNINKKYSGEIKYLIDNDATVTTKPAKNIKTFFNQRIRWASKTKFYSQFFVLFSGFVTLSMNLALFSTAILSLLYIIQLKYFFFLLISKTVIDFPLLFSASRHFNQQKLQLLYIPLQIIYFLYVTIVGILSFLINYKWKGRKF